MSIMSPDYVQCAPPANMCNLQQVPARRMHLPSGDAGCVAEKHSLGGSDVRKVGASSTWCLWGCCGGDGHERIVQASQHICWQLSLQSVMDKVYHNLVLLACAPGDCVSMWLCRSGTCSDCNITCQFASFWGEGNNVFSFAAVGPGEDKLLRLGVPTSFSADIDPSITGKCSACGRRLGHRQTPDDCAALIAGYTIIPSRRVSTGGIAPHDSSGA